MIAADEAPCFAGQFGDQRCAAMLTGVVESADLALQIAHHQYGRSCVAGEEPAAGVRDLIDMAGVEPGALPQDRKSVVKGKSVSVRVDLGGRLIIKKKKK